MQKKQERVLNTHAMNFTIGKLGHRLNSFPWSKLGQWLKYEFWGQKFFLGKVPCGSEAPTSNVDERRDLCRLQVSHGLTCGIEREMNN